MEVPIYLKSPSVITLGIYLLTSYYGYRKLSKGTIKWTLHYFLKDYTSAIFLMGIPVLIGDTTWVVASLLRFGSEFPTGVLQLVICIFRDLAALTTCFLFEWNSFVRKIVGFTRRTYLLIFLNVIFIAVWFLVAPDPSLTDFTYGIRFGYPVSRIILSMLISHGLGRVIIFLIYRSMWLI